MHLKSKNKFTKVSTLRDLLMLSWSESDHLFFSSADFLEFKTFLRGTLLSLALLLGAQTLEAELGEDGTRGILVSGVRS